MSDPTRQPSNRPSREEPAPRRGRCEREERVSERQRPAGAGQPARRGAEQHAPDRRDGMRGPSARDTVLRLGRGVWYAPPEGAPVGECSVRIGDALHPEPCRLELGDERRPVVCTPVVLLAPERLRAVRAHEQEPAVGQDSPQLAETLGHVVLGDVLKHVVRHHEVERRVGERE